MKKLCKSIIGILFVLLLFSCEVKGNVSPSTDLKNIFVPDPGENLGTTYKTEIYKYESPITTNAANTDSESLYNKGFVTTNMLTLEIVDEYHIKITNYTPLFFKYIKLSINTTTDTPIHFATITNIAPFTQYTATVNNEQYSAKVRSASDISTLVMSVNGSDANMQKLKKITIDWHIDGFRKFDSKWDAIYPEYARIYAAIFLNMAYLFSQAEFKDLVGTLYLHDGTNIVGNDVYYNQIITKGKIFRLGIVNTAEGLAGGTSYGINPRLVSQIALKHGFAYKGIGRTFVHELNHTYGYGHSGSMTYPIDAAVNLGQHNRSPSVAIAKLINKKWRTTGYMPYDQTDKYAFTIALAPNLGAYKKQIEDTLQKAIAKGWDAGDFTLW